jgi:hypothetical protein
VRPIVWLGLMLAALAHAVAALGSASVRAQPLYCSRWLDITTCSSPGGYTSTVTQWQGLTSGQDSDGNRVWRSHWHGFETTAVRPPER